jgi:probable phosphomutase (TIGR03848 family)
VTWRLHLLLARRSVPFRIRPGVWYNRPGVLALTTNLLLIRHAMTDWADKRLSGWLPGIHLNTSGRSQAESLPGRLDGIRFAAVYCGPLERARETAQPLAEALGLAVQVRQGLIEADCGDWAGRTLEELQKEDLWPVLHVYPGGMRFPGGESITEVQARMVAELDAICGAHPGETVAVVSHADPLKMAVAYYAGLPLDLFHRLSISPASVSAFEFTRFGPRLVCLNCTGSPPAFESKVPRQSKES